MAWQLPVNRSACCACHGAAGGSPEAVQEPSDTTLMPGSCVRLRAEGFVVSWTYPMKSYWVRVCKTLRKRRYIMKNNLSAGTQADDFGSTKPVVLADPLPWEGHTKLQNSDGSL